MRSRRFDWSTKKERHARPSAKSLYSKTCVTPISVRVFSLYSFPLSYHHHHHHHHRSMCGGRWWCNGRYSFLYQREYPIMDPSALGAAVFPPPKRKSVIFSISLKASRLSKLKRPICVCVRVSSLFAWLTWGGTHERIKSVVRSLSNVKG